MIDYKTLLNKTIEFDGKNRNLSAILWDNAEKKCLLQVTSDDTDTENFVFSVTNGNVTLQKCQNKGVPLFLSQEVFDTNGKRLGNLQNVFFTKNGVLRNLIVNEKVFTKGKIRCVGDVILIKEKSLLATRPKTRNKTTQIASDVDADSKNTVAVHNHSNSRDTRFITGKIRRKYGDFEFLAGRRVDKTIVNFQGEVMIKSDETITEETLRQAKISGKLIEIFLHAE